MTPVIFIQKKDSTHQFGPVSGSAAVIDQAGCQGD
jgi:hypothetical protein